MAAAGDAYGMARAAPGINNSETDFSNDQQKVSYVRLALCNDKRLCIFRFMELQNAVTMFTF